jgi:hypothetical protein
LHGVDEVAAEPCHDRGAEEYRHGHPRRARPQTLPGLGVASSSPSTRSRACDAIGRSSSASMASESSQ